MRLKKPNFVTFTFYTLISNLLIYILNFFIYKENVNYYECTEIKSYYLFLFSRKFELIYPESCDLNAYLQGVLNVQNFYTQTEYVYFDRPLFIFYISIFYYILKTILNPLSLSSMVLIKASFFVGQVVLTSTICIFMCKIFDSIKINFNKFYFTLPWLVSSSPMFKWHIYESTSMTFTFLIFLFGIYFAINLDNLNQNFYFPLVGVLFLFHRSAAIIIMYILIYAILKKKLNYILLSKSILFLIPIFLHYLILFFYTGITDHQAQGYRQFIWVIDFIQGKETIIGGYFCQSPKLALICYIKDFFNLIEYLLIPILYLTINFILNLRPKYFLYKDLLLVTFSFALLIQSFWLFIGWYPPIRFSYYGFGNLIIFLLILFYALIDNQNLRKLYIGAYSCYFLFLNHWNYPDIIKTNNYLFFSALLFLLLIVFIYKKNHDKLHIQNS
jgi:hypothetical protein